MPLSLSHADLTTGDEPRYEAVAAQYQTAGYQPVQGVRIRVAGGEYTSRAPDGQLQVVKDFQGRPGSTLLWSENVPWVEWTFSVPKAGLYSLELTYQQVPGKGASIQRGLQINGRYPFEEAKRLDLYRVWKDAHPPIPDADGNDVRAPQVEVPTWQTVDLNDGDGWYSQPFEFYFTPGPQRIRLLTIREPIAIGSLALVSPVDPPTYQNVLTEYKQRGYWPAPTGTIINLQAERPTAKADPTIRSEVSYDPLTEPPANGKRILNQLGGFRWRHGGEWVEWTINVPADGLYQLGFRELQGSTTALPVARTIAIDGRVPFREFWEVWFPYDSQWQFFRPHQANGQPYLLYLTKGQHTIRLTPVLGELRDVIWSVDDAQQAMADLLRQVMLITGPQPDPNRVWDLTTQIPDLVPRLQKMADDLDQQSQTLAQLAGYWPNAANSLRQVAEELRSLARDPDSMPGRLNDFDASETTLGNWSLNLTDAPLALDYIWLAAPDAVPPRATANLFERGVAAFQNFLASFKANYDSVGTTYGTGTGSGPVLTVWVGRGREWGEIMKDMIEEDFTPRTGIKVNLQVFPPGQLDAGGLNVLLLAASSGQAPDVATGVEPNLPVEFAMRGSIVDISQFPDYPEVAGWFRPGAIIPFEYQGKVYALPETQDFMMLFYRTDILNALHLKPPQTWQDVYDMIWILQQNG
ncbi:MAG TPA: hypothetical protein VKX96_05930, partial [Chloroflexota bacterium]|nr:hypothetical protein [Chloroflexota bacterium]